MLDKYENDNKNILDLTIYCINLDDRIDRWVLIENEYKKFCNKIIRVPSVKNEDNVLSCGLSFLKCITLAKNLNLKEILICEDDVTFHDNSIKIWNLCIQELPDDWDILLGGVSSFKNTNKSKYKYLVKLNDFSGEHMMLVNNKAFDKLFKYLNNKNIKHFDRFLGSCAKSKELNIYCCVPFVSVPILNGYSNIRKKYVSDNNYFITSLLKLIKLINK